MPTLRPSQLQEFATRLLQAGGASAAEAQIVGRSLVDANLRGYDSHGVMRIPYYVQAIKEGEVVPGEELTVLDEGPSRVVADGNWGFGQVQAVRLLKMLASKAHTAGQAIGTMTHSGHIGRLGEYCELAAAEGLVSLLMVNSHGAAVRVAPPGGKAPRLSTNPLAIGVPLGNEPLVLDFSTSATAEGKVRVKKIAGQQCPEGWTVYTKPGPRFQGGPDYSSTDMLYMTEVDRDNTLGLGKDVVLAGDVNADSFFVVMPQGGQMTTLTLRVPYPLGFAARAGSGRIDDPKAGWKGRGFWSSYSMYTPWHQEGGKGTRPKVVKFQVRPNILAK